VQFEFLRHPILIGVGVILRVAAVQAERRISRARSLTRLNCAGFREDAFLPSGLPLSDALIWPVVAKNSGVRWRHFGAVAPREA
jgi:hypothetical protein